jgi:hypothetical protein
VLVNHYYQRKHKILNGIRKSNIYHKSPYQMPDTVRALMVAIAAIEKQQKSIVRLQNLPGSAGKLWNKEEDSRLLQAFDADISINEISKLHGRTEGAIKSRLLKHGKIKNS